MMKDITSDNYESKKKYDQLENSLISEPKLNKENSNRGFNKYQNFEENYTPVNQNKERLNTERSTPTRNNTSGIKDFSRRDKLGSSWVNKVASGIEQYKIDIFDLLNQYDIDNDGYLTPSELRLSMLKMKLKLTEGDIDNMFGYFEISNVTKINIKDFARNFMNKILKKKTRY